MTEFFLNYFRSNRAVISVSICCVKFAVLEENNKLHPDLIQYIV